MKRDNLEKMLNFDINNRRELLTLLEEDEGFRKIPNEVKTSIYKLYDYLQDRSYQILKYSEEEDDDFKVGYVLSFHMSEKYAFEDMVYSIVGFYNLDERKYLF